MCAGRALSSIGLNCKKCRLLHLERVLVRSGVKEEPPQSPSRSDGTTSECDDALTPSRNMTTTASSSSGLSSSVSTSVQDRPLLARVRAAYDKMNFGRLMGELFARKNPPAPMQIDSRNYPMFPATFGGMNHANRVLMSCIMEFGNSLFPEFERLQQEEKRSISVKFFYTFRKFDDSYRSHKRFPDNMDRNFGSYTLWLSEDIIEHFFDDIDNGRGNIEEAKKIMLGKCNKSHAGREFLQRVNLDEEEFLGMVTLMFWAQNGLSEIAEISEVEEHYRNLVFSELHSYYRDVLHMENYASRLGELQMVLPLYERHQGVKEIFEVLRLLDIYSDDSFTYALGKA